MNDRQQVVMAVTAAAAAKILTEISNGMKVFEV